MFHFKKHYFLIGLLIFFSEVCIALFIHDGFVRPYLGDFLVVIMLYCFIRSMLNTHIRMTGVITVSIAYLVELCQYLNLLEWLGLEHNKAMRIVLGSTFEWFDILAYTIGVLTVVFIDLKINSNKSQRINFQ